VKKLICIGLTALLLFGIMCPAFAAGTVTKSMYGDDNVLGGKKTLEKIAEDLKKEGIKDVKPDFWAAESITNIVDAGFMAPDSNGYFNPDKGVTYSSAIAVLAKAMGIAEKNDTTEQAIAKAKAAGLVDSETESKLNSSITRLGFAKLIAKALNVKPLTGDLSKLKNKIKDFALFSSDELAIVAALEDLGIFSGFPDGTFRPDEVITNAQLAALLDRLLRVKVK